MSRKRLGSIDVSSVEEMREGAERSAAQRRGNALGQAAPIGKMAGEAAHSLEGELLRLRKENTGLKGGSDAWQVARDEGRVIELIALDEIEAHGLSRDRRNIDLDGDAFAELKSSIQSRGQQTPIEVSERSSAQGKHKLISGYRRLSALKALFDETGDPAFSQVRALIARPRATVDEMVAMVEENEIRQDISFYERGRICCIAADDGVCETVEEAIVALFPNSSRNRRYKIRNFTLIHGRLAPYLDYPEAIGERLGGRLAQCLKDGREAELIAVLSDRGAKFPNAAEELAVLDAFVSRKGRFAEEKEPKPEKLKAEWSGLNGTSARAEVGKGRVTVTIQGLAPKDADDLEQLLSRIGAALNDPSN